MPGPSGNKVGNLNANVGATLTFRVDGGEDGATATLFATVSNRASSFKFTYAMKITLNGTEIQSDAMTRTRRRLGRVLAHRACADRA